MITATTMCNNYAVVGAPASWASIDAGTASDRNSSWSAVQADSVTPATDKCDDLRFPGNKHFQNSKFYPSLIQPHNWKKLQTIWKEINSKWQEARRNNDKSGQQAGDFFKFSDNWSDVHCTELLSNVTCHFTSGLDMIFHLPQLVLRKCSCRQIVPDTKERMAPAFFIIFENSWLKLENSWIVVCIVCLSYVRTVSRLERIVEKTYPYLSLQHY